MADDPGENYNADTDDASAPPVPTANTTPPPIQMAANTPPPDDDDPPPPPGFTIDPKAQAPVAASAAPGPSDDDPPPPPGFTLEAAPPGNAPASKDEKPPPPLPNDPRYQQSMTSLDPEDPAAKKLGKGTGTGFVSDADLALPAKAVAKASLAVDDKTQMQRLSQYTGIPLKYFGKVDGKIVRWVPDKGVYAEVAPSAYSPDTGAGVIAAAGDALKKLPATLGSGVGEDIPMVGGFAGGALGASLSGGTASVLGATGGAALADIGRQAMDKWLSGEDVATKHYDLLHAGGEGLNAGAGQLVGLGVGKLAGKVLGPGGKAAKAFEGKAATTPENQAAWQATEDLAQQHGFTGDAALTPGQLTGSRSLLTQERQVARDPKAMDQFTAKKEAQREGATVDSFNKALEDISPTGGREAQIGAFKSGADEVLGQMETARKTEANAAYAKAFDGKKPWYDDSLDDLMNRPSMKRAFQQAQKAQEEAPGELKMQDIYRLPPGKPADPMNLTFQKDQVPDWRTWQRIKQGLDDLVEKETDPVTGKLSPDGRRISNTRGELMAKLKDVNKDWADADLKFGTASDAINAVKEGGVGLLKRMSGPDRQANLNKIFSGGNLLPEDVSKMRQLYVNAGKADEWNAGFRGYLEDALSKALDRNTNAEVGNVPGKLYSGLWGDESQKAVIKAALGDENLANNMDKLMQVYRAAARGLPEGSPTVTDLGGGKEGLLSTLADVASIQGISRPFKSAGRVLSAMFKDPEAQSKLANYLLSDQGKKDLLSMSPISPKSKAWAQRAGKIAYRAGMAEGKHLLSVGQGTIQPGAVLGQDAPG